MRNSLKIIFLLVIVTVCLCHCKSEDETAKYAFVQGKVLEKGTEQSISGVKITVFDLKNDAPMSHITTTNENGGYEFSLPAGTYYLKMEKQGYEVIPDSYSFPNILSLGQKTQLSVNYELTKTSLTGAGYITGSVKSENAPVANVLVVTDNGTEGYSAISDANGNYTIYNVPAGSYSVNAYKTGNNASAVTTTVTSNTETKNINFNFTSAASATVTGAILFPTGVYKQEVDVRLINYFTQDTVRGLRTRTMKNNYEIKNVPVGKYIVNATYDNDSLVANPDEVLNSGKPVINVTSGSGNFVKDINVVKCVSPIAPTHSMTNIYQLEIPLKNLTFSWEKFPAADSYVVEITNLRGKTLWGGFDTSTSPVTPRMNIKATADKTSYSSSFEPKTALSPLIIGEMYRWKVYALKNDAAAVNGWRVISVSEEQRGLIKLK